MSPLTKFHLIISHFLLIAQGFQFLHTLANKFCFLNGWEGVASHCSFYLHFPHRMISIMSVTQIEDNITELCKHLPLLEESLEYLVKLCSRYSYSPGSEWTGLTGNKNVHPFLAFSECSGLVTAVSLNWLEDVAYFWLQLL